jgi:hypothetical protein
LSLELGTPAGLNSTHPGGPPTLLQRLGLGISPTV